MAGLKIVAFIGTPAYLNYFVNEIADKHDIALVIKENSRKHLLKKIREKGLWRSIQIIAQHILNKHKIKRIHNEILGNKWQSIAEHIPLMETYNINSPEVLAQLQAIKPDLIVVQGTTLIKNSTIKDIPLVFNLHWGLSPYYRGSYCTEWALLNEDILNIGYTLHKISARIDGGDILFQGRPQISPQDDTYSNNMKLTRDGAKAMSMAIDHIKKGVPLHFHTQDSSQGELYLTKHWQARQKKLLPQQESKIAAMLSQPRIPAKKIIDQW